ncbi:unnamed protein product [Ascophyllum nodosum]
MTANRNLEIPLDSTMRGGGKLRWRHIISMLSVLLLQARVSMGKAFHPFLRKNESGALTANFEKTVQGPSISMHHSVFGDNWAMDFGDGGNGCESGRGSFMWRGQGFGSNINNLLNAWVYAIAVENWNDMAVVFSPRQLSRVECHEESDGEASVGWDCMFSPMPHLCTFQDSEEWTDFMLSRHVSETDREEALRLDQDAVRFHPEKIVDSLRDIDADHFDALAAMASYLWSYMTPWLKRDIDIVVRAPKEDVFREHPFLGVHIRRGDKVANKEASNHASEEYLVAAESYIVRHSEMSVEDIKGIWVASDDPAALDEVRAVAPAIFPNVDNSTIFWAAGGVPDGPAVATVKTRTDKQSYAELVYTFADLHQLTHASVFVGTFSSNIGRLVALLRQNIGKKQASTTISIDRNGWTPGRKTRRLKDPEELDYGWK